MDVGLLQNVEVGGSGFKDLRRLPVHTVSILPCVDDRPQAISVVEGVVVKTGLVFLDVFLFANVELRILQCAVKFIAEGEGRGECDRNIPAVL